MIFTPINASICHIWLHRKIVILGPTSYLCQSSAILSEQVVMVAVSGCIIWQFTALSFQILLLLKSLCKKPWGSTKEILSIYYFSLPADEGGEKIFISFSIFQFIFGNFDWGGRGSWHRSNVPVLLALYKTIALKTPK